ncbi:hypothetical protein AVEN_211934-1 [Araneus ventricosus]|uniref:Uncharacterized protein n=1 Tax=Araneus ventricosus TaxID=182803 RepID=A0A4Y1ZP61_ARAVE|nr:hypothetical protein AVEN_19302-1 [Araneus ventricosus]GBL61183.1 hypothetical protein AVEN_33405-1 [Araneus ventricosus]GBL61246.1 hypothetical protein AVEN_140153-1 [Araneus ventricosus]GBL61274.1 hypothetical protein AVEN_211934-1 [Araneus ventricosus]
MVMEAFVPSVNYSIETGVEENRVQVTESLNYGFLNFGIGSEMASCQVLLQGSEDMKITCCEIRDVMDVLGRPDLCSSSEFVLPSSNSLKQNHTYFRELTLSP